MRRRRGRAYHRSTWLGLALLALAAWTASPTAAQDGRSVTIHLDEFNASGIQGTATLTANNGTTDVTIQVTGTDVDIPIHIHEGTCDDLNPVPTYPLTNASSEPTTTVVDVPLGQLLSSPFAINAHQPAEALEALLDPSLIVACGNITAGVGGQVAASLESANAPAVGVGTMAGGDGTNHAVLVGLGIVAGALGAGGLLLRRREAQG